MRLIAKPISAEAMQPFGGLIAPPAQAGARAVYTHWLDVPDAGRTPRLHVNFVPRSFLPHRITVLEKHPHAAQIFLPLQARRYLVVVAPSFPDGSPDLRNAESFIAPDNLGVVYRAGVWHAGATALDDLAHFAVCMGRNDRDDDVFLTLDDPLEITL
jgi:ureidoglycolate lyase